jgi:hypothetical protein
VYCATVQPKAIPPYIFPCSPALRQRGAADKVQSINTPFLLDGHGVVWAADKKIPTSKLNSQYRRTYYIGHKHPPRAASYTQLGAKRESEKGAGDKENT